MAYTMSIPSHTAPVTTPITPHNNKTGIHATNAKAPTHTDAQMINTSRAIAFTSSSYVLLTLMLKDFVLSDPLQSMKVLNQQSGDLDNTPTSTILLD